ncbi:MULTISPECIES: type II toxin-antitoxin system Phd/YefM family antitoxin [Roseobacteraceae]|uniref:Antitoxin n=1 Tax=Ruegeria halocynthiae TaxID=985054 RepID=A0A1H3DE73_9RHOB|nr:MULTISPECIES: type II toxin-antitoxin system prevent-host-death family antitoxin [Ruegeria]SDX64438.1 prevent-host-death family protein [Ruegeria halocynthiae]
MLFTIQKAKNQLPELIDAALAGEDVVITIGTKPAVRLVAIPQYDFKLGVLEGKVGATPDFLEPLSSDELKAWEDR